ncbi:MAG: hypothetical protein AABY22_12700 [Nanoarchaeota archaeon]
MRIKLSELKKMIKEEYKEVLNYDHPEDVKALEDTWAGSDKQLVQKIDHKKANKVKENKGKRARKLELDELKSMILGALHEHKTPKASKKSKKR